ncbi:MAG: DUF2628 domain-containing protein [Beijerinckiaceae bacterium]
MSSWTIHLPPPDRNSVSYPERFIAIKDGIRPFVIGFGPVWFLAKRLWWGALGAFLIEAALIGSAALADLPRPAVTMLFAAYRLLLALEASTIHRWTLRRKAWRDAGAVVARGRAEAELRAAFLIASLAPDSGMIAPRTAAMSRSSRPRADEQQPVLGLFPEAGPR